MQDGFDLYLHGFIVTDDGHWAVVQQGMNGDRRQARRYHWLSEGLASFVDAPHTAIAGEPRGEIINLADRRAEPSRRGQLDLLSSLGPDRIVGEVRRLSAAGDASAAAQPDQPVLPHLVMPAHHDVRASDVNIGRLHATLAAAADAGSKDFAELLLTPGVGARTVRSLSDGRRDRPWRALPVCRPGAVFHRARRQGPHPFPVPVTVYDQTIRVLKTAVAKARLGREEELAALKRLDDQARRLEGCVTGPAFAQVLDHERQDSHAYGGRSVFGWEPSPRRSDSG